MATFQVSKKNKKRQKRNVKTIAGWTLLGLCTFIFLFSATSLIGVLQDFFLGIFGVFVYPLTVVGFVIALALLNDKRYVMPVRYAVFLILSLYFFLSIIQLIIIGSPNGLTYGQYIAKNYTKKFTAGGMIIGFLPASLAKLMGLIATYILLSIAFAVCVAFFVEAVISLKRTNQAEKPIKLQLKEEKTQKPIVAKDIYAQSNRKVEQNKEEVNIMYNASVEQEEKRELTAREKLGLVGGYKQKIGQPYQPQEIKLPEEKNDNKVPEGMSMREFLLSPPKVDLEKFKETQARLSKFETSINYQRPNVANSQPPQVNINNDTKLEIEKNINELKQEENIAQEETQEPKANNLPDVKPEEITNEAEDIIRSVIMQEKIEREEFNIPDKQELPQAPQPNFSRNDDVTADDDGDSEPEINKIERNYESRNFSRFDDDSKNEEDSLKLNESDKDYINFDDIEEPDEEKEPETLQRDNLARNQFEREDLTRNRRDNLLSDSLNRESTRSNFGREDKLEVKRDGKEFVDDLDDDDKEEPMKRDDFRRELGRENRSLTVQNNSITPVRQKPLDEIERQKRFVGLEEEKKEEVIKPYKYKRPSLDLLTTVSDDLSSLNADMPLKRTALENALENFGVPAKVVNVVVGPTVTRYEIEMPEGISVKRVLSLDADIAYALSANGSIRIEAPIPGRSMVGIEVPNPKVAKVSIKDVLQSKEFSLSPSPLTFALGKDITGNVKVCNLQKMPHLLVAGTTGSGKSVCLNTIITSLLYKSSPDQVKFIMIDPKQVELSMYEGLPHMVVPKVITDATKAVNALQWAVDEMERRFRLISDERVRNIDEYNMIDKVLQNKVRKMPYIVIIFDEFADFMMVAKNEIEDKIKRLAGKARAAGIHLILATQRPSTDVVTGTLKANLPARIAFKVAGRVDSEVIMGSPGAEKLLGFGDMLYKPADTSPQRLQGCLIETQETRDIVNYIIENNEEIFDEEAFNAINNPNKSSNGNGGNENNGVDPLLPQALKICIDNGVASTTMVQRKLSIGYPRAARIVDQMEERGYISSAEGSKQRSVYISIEEFYSIFGDIYD